MLDISACMWLVDQTARDVTAQGVSLAMHQADVFGSTNNFGKHFIVSRAAHFLRHSNTANNCKRRCFIIYKHGIHVSNYNYSIDVWINQGEDDVRIQCKS